VAEKRRKKPGWLAVEIGASTFLYLAKTYASLGKKRRPVGITLHPLREGGSCQEDTFPATERDRRGEWQKIEKLVGKLRRFTGEGKKEVTEEKGVKAFTLKPFSQKMEKKKGEPRRVRIMERETEKRTIKGSISEEELKENSLRSRKEDKKKKFSEK